MRVWGDTGRYPDLCAGILETTEKIPFQDIMIPEAVCQYRQKLQLRIVAEMEEACQKNSLKKENSRRHCTDGCSDRGNLRILLCGI